METFKHNFKTIFGVIDTAGINGYTQCLNEVYKHIAAVTEFNPAKRFIDAVDILDKIAATNGELSQLMAEEAENIGRELNGIIAPKPVLHEDDLKEVL